MPIFGLLGASGRASASSVHAAYASATEAVQIYLKFTPSSLVYFTYLLRRSVYYGLYTTGMFLVVKPHHADRSYNLAKTIDRANMARDVSSTLVASTSTSTSTSTLLSSKNKVSASTSVIASHA